MQFFLYILNSFIHSRSISIAVILMAIWNLDFFYLLTLNINFVVCKIAYFKTIDIALLPTVVYNVCQDICLLWCLLHSSIKGKRSYSLCCDEYSLVLNACFDAPATVYMLHCCQGHFKDGTEPGTCDCRWFGAVYFLDHIIAIYAVFIFSELLGGYTAAELMYTLAGIGKIFLVILTS